ncbi:macrosialin-like [Arapaima gigas]
MTVAFLLFLLACAVALPQDGRKHHKPPASLSPPGEFDVSIQTSQTTHHSSAVSTSPTTASTSQTSTHISTTGKTITTPTTHTTSSHTTVHPTTQIKTTPPAPTPSTTLEVGNYSVNAGGSLCVRAQMAIQIQMSKRNETGVFIIQPNKTHADGGCDNTTANLTLLFKEGNLTFLFLRNITSNRVFVTSISFNVNYPIISSGPTQHSAMNNSVNQFSATISHCYSCKNSSVSMGEGYQLDISMVQLQAFNFTNGNFGSPEPCPADLPNYHVAIAVGIVLLILIIIVVVAYFIGRRKRMDGYQSL